MTFFENLALHPLETLADFGLTATTLVLIFKVIDILKYLFPKSKKKAEAKEDSLVSKLAEKLGILRVAFEELKEKFDLRDKNALKDFDLRIQQIELNQQQFIAKQDVFYELILKQSGNEKLLLEYQQVINAKNEENNNYKLQQTIQEPLEEPILEPVEVLEHPKEVKVIKKKVKKVRGR